MDELTFEQRKRIAEMIGTRVVTRGRLDGDAQGCPVCGGQVLPCPDCELAPSEQRSRPTTPSQTRYTPDLAVRRRLRLMMASAPAHARRSKSKYTQDEINLLGYKGKAYKSPVDGHFSFPIADRQDVLNAVHAVGRSGLADKAPLRKFIAGRAKALGAARLIPTSWS